MSDPDDARMRELVRRLVDMAPPAPPFPEESATRLTPEPERRRRPAVAAFAIAAVAVLLLIAVPLLLTGGADDPIVAATTTTAAEATTTTPGEDTTTTTAVESTTTTTNEPEATSTTVAESTTTTQAPTDPGIGIDVSDAEWIRTVNPDAILDSNGDVIVDTDAPLLGTKTAAWDTDSGIVTVTADSRLRWIRPGADTFIPVEWSDPDPPILLDVVLLDAGPAAAMRTFGFDVMWVDLNTGGQVEGDPDRADVFEDQGDVLGAQGRKVRVFFPENADVERDETGALIWPYELPQLIVSDLAGDELVRITLGSEQDPFVKLHDFDGRRVVVSQEGWEPALAPRTVFIIDLECSDCAVETVEIDADTIDLVGVLLSEGPVATGFDI